MEISHSNQKKRAVTLETSSGLWSYFICLQVSKMTAGEDDEAAVEKLEIFGLSD